VEELSRNELPKEQYPYVKLPESLVGEGTAGPSAAPARKVPHSVRTIRYNWAAQSQTKSSIETSRYISYELCVEISYSNTVLISARQTSHNS